MNTPIAIVDKDGNLWPWDGREVSPYILATGSRYIYSREEYAEALTAFNQSLKSQEAARAAESKKLDDMPEEREAVSKKDVTKALGMSTVEKDSMATMGDFNLNL